MNFYFLNYSGGDIFSCNFFILVYKENSFIFFFFIMSDQGNFSEFSNLYAISKTLRFELKPIWKTKDLLDEKSWLFLKDKRIEEIYQNIIKPCLNDLHSQLIEDSLGWWAIIGWLDDDVFNEFQKDKTSKEYEKIKKSLRKSVVELMKNSKYQHADWFKDLMDKKVLDIIIKVFWDTIYQKEDDKKNYECEDLIWKTYNDLIETYFKWFFTYLSNFNINRSNLYKDDWKASRVATRIVDENLPRFFQNKINYDKIEDILDLANEEKEVFETVFFNDSLNQRWIENYNNKIGKLNSKINEYNQKNNLKWKDKLPKLILLYKQILAKVEKGSMDDFINSLIETPEELKKNMGGFIQVVEDKTNCIKEALFDKLNDFDLWWIYIKKSNLKFFSNRYLINYSMIDNLLPKTDKDWKLDAKSQEEVVSLSSIKEAFLLKKENEEIFKKEYFEENIDLFDLFINSIKKDIKAFIDEIMIAKWNYKKYLLDWNFELNLNNKEKNIDLWDGILLNRKNILKDYLDKVIYFDKFVSRFTLIKWQWENKTEVVVENPDTDFYNILKEYNTDFAPFKLYNSVRNYLTKKHYSTNKMKLNFDNSTLLDGWDKNKESDNFGVLLRKDWKYYLALMKKWNNKFFDENKNPKLYHIDWTDYFEKIDYKLLPWPDKMLPKVFFSAKNIEYFAPSKEILNIRNYSSHTKNWSPQKWFDKKEFNIDDCRKFIDFYKKSLEKHKERRNFWFTFKNTDKYEDLSQFYSDVSAQWYNLKYKKVKKDILDNAVDNWNLHLFQIYNKDFAEKSKWNEKLHTMYRKALFEDKNFEDWTVFKLNWQAEIFFRPKSIKQKAQKKLTTKQNDSAIEKKRYTENKIMFHCPFTINFVNKKEFKINDKVKEYAKNNKLNVIWIDRWEKHLLYYSLIDEDGKIKESNTLNTLISKLPNWEEKEIPYADKLIKMEWDRDKERKNRDEIETIKELKEGYISQVVYKIVNMAIDNNAIIVMEDLNSGFKRWRQKVERQVYQKFELALAKKLNYVVSKNKDKNELWWLYKAYQLTPKIDNFQDIYSQTGIVFYTQAGYTSTTCPKCWFRKNIYRKYKSIADSKKFIEGIKIEYKNWNYMFEYNIESKKDSKKNDLKKLNWQVNTRDQIRFHASKNKDWKWRNVEEFNITEKFNELFEKYSIDKDNIVKWLLSLSKDEAKPFKEFMFYRNLLLQIRNSKEWDDGWFIQCPICWFHSKNDFQWHHFNGDANWAYNIARKWLIILDKIRKKEKSLGITNVEWDNFSQT